MFQWHFLFNRNKRSLSCVSHPDFFKFRFINLILGAAVLAVGFYLYEQGIFIDSPWLLWLMPYGFNTLDYWPLVPSFGLLLLGMFAGKMLYPDGNRGFNIPEISNPIASAVMLLGRHPLLVYIAHLPIIFGVLLALFPDKILPYIK